MKAPFVKILTRLALGAALAIWVAACKPAGDDHDHDHADHDHAEESATAGYPLTTCVVSGEDLGSMGDPVEVTHNGTTVKLCCDNCIEKFNSDADTYVAKVLEAAKPAAE